MLTQTDGTVHTMPHDGRHTTGLNCWCVPGCFVLCPNCEGSEYGCWRCHGSEVVGMVTATGDAVVSLCLHRLG